jgi:hypothetical protein
MAALGAEMFGQPLADAARRVANKTVAAIRAKDGKGLGAIGGAMDEELDVLAERFIPLADEGRRNLAAAALSLMATEAVAAHRPGLSVLERFPDLPFLRVIFRPHPPARDVTALELPYRLVLSPVPEAAWHHATSAVVQRGRTELWHTRLTGTPGGTGRDLPVNVRALWSPDYPLPDLKALNDQFRMSLDGLDRKMLVRLMSGFDEIDTHNNPFHPHTARSNRLALSALGALLDVEGNWNPPNIPQVSLQQWRHLATLGRDHYVRVVYRGFLHCFGHAASLVKVTERKFESLPKNGKNRVAVLRQRFFIIVRQRVKDYDGSGHVFEGRNFPFTSVEILTRVTPSLLSPDLDSCFLTASTAPHSPGVPGLPPRACFWPLLGPNTPFLFQVAATDLAGTRHTFAMPLAFVGSEANEVPGKPNEIPAVMLEIINRYDLQHNAPRRTTSLGGHSVCFAPPKIAAQGDPRLPASDMEFFSAVRNVSSDEARFYPEMKRSSVGIIAIRRLLQQPDATVDVEYPEAYKANEFGGGNRGELFLKTITPFPLTFGSQVKSDTLGGLATPGMAILGLSRISGPVSAQPPADPKDIESALKDVVDNTFNPAGFFKDAKILGGVDLGMIVAGASSLADAKVPKLLSSERDGKIEARFDWNTQITNADPAGMFVPNAGGATTLEMQGVVSSPIGAAGTTTFQATATIVHFKVNLFGAVTLWFDRLRFTSTSGSKPDVAVDLHPTQEAVVFGGPLEFVNELRNVIPSNGFSDPPSLSVTPSGISAGYSLSIPSLAVGIFALEHLSIGAAFLLPFDAKPAEVRFNFAERQRPFSLTVSLLGGGGFLAIGLGADGVREVEAAIEFGAALSISLGVASGSVEIKAGIYFHWQTKSVELAGYVRLHGELSVLGLISASLTFNLQLAYLKDSTHSVVWGEATLEVEIEILFLSFSVSVKCRREFGGSDGDPKFLELIPDQPTWDDYCGAFAAEA